MIIRAIPLGKMYYHSKHQNEGNRRKRKTKTKTKPKPNQPNKKKVEEKKKNGKRKKKKIYRPEEVVAFCTTKLIQLLAFSRSKLKNLKIDSFCWLLQMGIYALFSS